LENNENKKDNLNDLRAINANIEENIAKLQANNSTNEEKKEAFNLIEKFNKIKQEVISRLTIEKKPIKASSYASDGKKIVKRFSVFSTIDILNRNSDLFHKTKNTTNTALKTIYSAEEIKELMEKTNANSYENLVSKVEKAMKNPVKGVYVNNIANKVAKFLADLKAEKPVEVQEKNANKYVNTQLKKYANGPSALVSRISSIYGDNRYYNKVNAYINNLTPLFVKFEDDKEADNKVYEIENYVKDTYNYSFKLDANTGINKLTRTIKIANQNSKMDNCVNMLYSVAKNLKGSQKTNVNVARKLLNKDENNDFLTKKNRLNNYIGVKYTVVDKQHKVKNIFKAHSETISDVVSTLTTAFMARFVFDSKYYAEIERDLTEQAANKMKYLSFSKDSNEDYWVNTLIQERLKLNIAQVCAANNITDAKQLLQVYNNNGTVVLNPEKVNCIDDLVFSLQYTTKESVENTELVNVSENKIKVTKTIKNKKQKVKRPPVFNKKPNKYLEHIRGTDLYKKYYEKYLNEYTNIKVDKNNLNLENELQEIISSTDKNLDALTNLAKKEDLNPQDAETLTATAAANDVVREIAEQAQEELKAQEEVETVEVNEAEETSEETTQQTEEEATEQTATETTEEVKEEKVEVVKFEIVEKEELKNENIDEINSEYPVQLTIDDIILKEEKEENTETNELTKVTPVFLTTKKVKDLSDEEISKKVAKHYTKIIHGANGKVGVVGQNLNYRIIEKKSSKNASINDSERLDDPQFKKANKIRDEKINLIIEDLTQKTVEYFKENKESLPENVTIAKLCNMFIKSELNYAEDKSFTITNLKNCLSVLITESVNPSLKDLNLELYTGKKTYKNYHENITNLIMGEE